MYVCMYVCMYMRMCVFVCVYACMHELCMYVCMHARMNYAGMYACMYACMYVCMYVYACRHAHKLDHAEVEHAMLSCPSNVLPRSPAFRVLESLDHSLPLPWFGACFIEPSTTRSRVWLGVVFGSIILIAATPNLPSICFSSWAVRTLLGPAAERH